jgi:hypothetical protein
VTLTRYGADIEWNMNLLLRPGDFQREMQLKLSAQEESLRAALVRIGYDLLMTEGTDLIAALINSNPHFRSNPGAAERSAERIYTSSVFGAMAKVRFAPQSPRPLRIASLRIAKRYSRSARARAVPVPGGEPHGRGQARLGVDHRDRAEDGHDHSAGAPGASQVHQVRAASRRGSAQSARERKRD